MNQEHLGSLDIVQLYPRDMNIYGDWGNTLTLKRRAERYGYEVRIHDYNPGDPWPDDADLFVGGGGQDSGQFRVAEDLARISPKLHEAAEAERVATAEREAESADGRPGSRIRKVPTATLILTLGVVVLLVVAFVGFLGLREEAPQDRFADSPTVTDTMPTRACA